MFGNIQLGNILENAPDNDQGNDLVLLGDRNGEGTGQMKNQQVYLVYQYKRKGGINSSNGADEELVGGASQIYPSQVVQRYQQQVRREAGDAQIEDGGLEAVAKLLTEEDIEKLVNESLKFIGHRSATNSIGTIIESCIPTTHCKAMKPWLEPRQAYACIAFL